MHCLINFPKSLDFGGTWVKNKGMALHGSEAKISHCTTGLS